MADRTIKPDDTNDLVLQNNDGSAKLELNEDQTVKVTTGSASGDDFTVNTSQLVVEGDTGDVGIGTTDPQELLHLNGTEAVIKLVDSAVSGAGFIDFDGSSLQLNTNRNPNTGAHTNASKSHATIILGGADGGSNILFGTKDSNNANATQRLEILSNGNVEVKTGNLVIGTDGRGIDFSADGNPTRGVTSSSILDDYEEGGSGVSSGSNSIQWFAGSTNLSYSSSYEQYVVGYTKIGRMVTVKFSLDNYNSGGNVNLGSGNLQIYLPYNVVAESDQYLPGQYNGFLHYSHNGTVGKGFVYCGAGASHASLRRDHISDDFNADGTNRIYLYGSLTYFTS